MDLRRVLSVVVAAAAATPLLTSPVLADPRDDVLQGAARCNSIANDRTFLDCYYGAAQPLRAQLGLPPAPGSQQILVPRSNAPIAAARPNASVPPGAQVYAAPPPGAPVYAAPPAEKPGFFSRMFTHTDVKAEPPTRMTSYKFEAGGFFVVTLANGQTWRQSHGDTMAAKWRARPETYAVQILPGAQFGANRMKVGKSEVYEVELVR